MHETETPVETDLATLTQLNEQYIESYLKADVDWYREHLAEDFRCIESNGSVLDRERFLSRTAEGSDLTEYRLQQVEIRVFGDFALVHGIGTFRRQDFTTGTSRYTDVYLRVGAEWKAISAQVTRMLSRRRESLR